MDPGLARQALVWEDELGHEIGVTLADRPFLLGDRFSRADLTACALLAPLVGIGRSEEDLEVASPPAVQALRRRHAGGRVFEWVARTYADHRRRVNAPWSNPPC